MCLTWVEEGPNAIEGEPVLRSEHAPLAPCETAHEYVEAIRNAAASLVPEYTPATALARARLRRSRARSTWRKPGSRVRTS